MEHVPDIADKRPRVPNAEFQLERGGTWGQGQADDNFGPDRTMAGNRDEIAERINWQSGWKYDASYQNGNTRTKDCPDTN